MLFENHKQPKDRPMNFLMSCPHYFAAKITKQMHRKPVGGARMKEWMKRICPCFTPSRIALAESVRETVSLPRIGTLSTLFFCLEPWSTDCTTFTLHDLTDFYVESVTAHHIKINDHSCFQPLAKLKNETKIKTSLKARVPLVFLGALRSLRVLRIGRIGSGCLML